MSSEADRQLVAHPCGFLAEQENSLAEWSVAIFSPAGELEPTLQQFDGRV